MLAAMLCRLTRPRTERSAAFEDERGAVVASKVEGAIAALSHEGFRELLAAMLACKGGELRGVASCA
jgi:hypothetical protein